MRRDRGLSDIIAWLAFFLILFLLILKFIGINTNFLIEYTFYFSGIYLIGWAMHKLQTAVEEIKELNKFKLETIKEINKIKINLSSNKSRKN
jgi:hypothetical protein